MDPTLPSPLSDAAEAAEVAARIPIYAVQIAVIVLLAAAVIFMAPRLARWLIRPLRFSSQSEQLTPARRRTLEQLLTSLVAFVVVAVAMLAMLWLFVGSQQLIWIVGLSAPLSAWAHAASWRTCWQG